MDCRTSLVPKTSFGQASLPPLGRVLRHASVKDCVHAATCLQLGTTPLSNNQDYDAIERAGILRRMTMSEAIRAGVGGRKQRD